MFNISSFSDTICFSESAKRFNERDIVIVKKLENILGENRPTRFEIYQQLASAKNLSTSLSFESLLIRDKKDIEYQGLKVTVASLSGMLVSDSLTEENLKSLAGYCLNNKYVAAIILGIKNNNPNTIKRDLAIYSENTQLLEKVRK